MQSNLTPESLADKAETLAKSGDLAGAIAHLKQAVKVQPYFMSGWMRLSQILFETDHFKEAVQVTQAAERFDLLAEDFAQIQSAMQSQQFAKAEHAAQQMLLKQPGHPRAAFTLAHLAGAKNNPENKVKALQLGLSHFPASLVLRHMLIGASEEAGDYAGAVEAARILVQTEESFPSLWALITVLLRYGLNEELLGVCDRARDVAGSDPKKLSEIELVRGQTLRVMGRREDSIATYRKCLAHNRENAGAWWALADMKNFEFSDADSDAIRALIDTRPKSDPDRCIATFALAKAAESAGDWDKSIALYHQANAAYPQTTFDSDQFDGAIAARIRAFDAASLQTQAAPKPDGPTPIFILGLPRSGSTLLEQILASHSRIEGTIEQPVLPSISRKAHKICALKYNGDVLDKIGALTNEELWHLGRAYISDGALFRAKGTPYFTDKLPFNFLHVGLIHKILPHAVIIDARRNPMDCGFSLYKQHFPTGVDFSYDLKNIAAYYNAYLRLMDHWDSVLPGRVFRIQYEELVRAPERHVRALLDHIGLEFEDSCLNFHLNDRAVRTASSEQVRQPINAKGIGVWRNVAHDLVPLKDSLGDAALAHMVHDRAIEDMDFAQ